MKRVAVLALTALLVSGVSTGALAFADSDADGVSEVREFLGPTDPTVADTDGDGLDDGTELERESDPTDADTDDDGLNDREESAVHETDPVRADTDGDGLPDAAEVNEYPTSATVSDTDGDGLPDADEVEERSTDPTVADTDDDALDDGPEVREYGTDPTAADTDDDGLGDGVEVRGGSALAQADPLRKDVFLEIDYMRGTTVPERKLERVERAFANAPVTNPDGSSGISLHVRVSDSPIAAEQKTSLSEYSNTYYRSAYDTAGNGYFHALVVKEVPDESGNRVGLTSTGNSGMIIEDRPSRVRVAKTIMHELGHNLGLHPDEHRGIDSYEVQPKRYPSVMNYHRLGGCDCHYDYSDGSHGPGDFDDWDHIASVLDEQTPNASEATVP
ncbi:hypothetical protein [Halorussus aquaticus]|uniref:Thrombospondin type 3 repeat-containing protein n=1 Tax=Halorussus aquaticus TaxID=2953748 RepID=A0ABD5PYY0_9EURY|nr:hypothetical protein [Halorussus aquaticus]